MALSPGLLELLACPVDRGPLELLPDGSGLRNPRLGLTYRIDDGVPVLLVPEAPPPPPAR